MAPHLRLTGALVAALVCPVSIAQAQDASVEASAALSGGVVPACAVQPYAPPVGADTADRIGAAERPTMLLAYCRGAGIVLGEMDRYQVFINRTTGALVVEIEHMGRRRVMLLQRDGDGQLAVEDIAGALSVAAGRTPTGGLRGVATDYAGFASDGVIAVTDEADGGEVPVRGTPGRPTFSLADHNRDRLSVVAAARAALAEGAR